MNLDELKTAVRNIRCETCGGPLQLQDCVIENGNPLVARDAFRAGVVRGEHGDTLRADVACARGHRFILHGVVHEESEPRCIMIQPLSRPAPSPELMAQVSQLAEEIVGEHLGEPVQIPLGTVVESGVLTADSIRQMILTRLAGTGRALPEGWKLNVEIGPDGRASIFPVRSPTGPIELETDRPIEAGALIGIDLKGKAIQLSDPDPRLEHIAVAREELEPGVIYVYPERGAAYRKPRT